MLYSSLTSRSLCQAENRASLPDGNTGLHTTAGDTTAAPADGSDQQLAPLMAFGRQECERGVAKIDDGGGGSGEAYNVTCPRGPFMAACVYSLHVTGPIEWPIAGSGGLGCQTSNSVLNSWGSDDSLRKCSYVVSQRSQRWCGCTFSLRTWPLVVSSLYQSDEGTSARNGLPLTWRATSFTHHKHQEQWHVGGIRSRSGMRRILRCPKTAMAAGGYVWGTSREEEDQTARACKQPSLGRRLHGCVSVVHTLG